MEVGCKEIHGDFFLAGNKILGAMLRDTSSSDDIYTSMEAINESHINGHNGNNGFNGNIMMPDPDFMRFSKPSKTNPNVVFKRPSSMSSMMY